MKINHVKDEEFKKYGRILENIKVEGILKVMEKIPIPESTVYAASVSELEDVVEEMEQLRIKGYGGLPIQIGYCNGNNHKLNAVEYHRCSEINIASTDLILILGCLQDVSEEEVIIQHIWKRFLFHRERLWKFTERHYIMHLAMHRQMDSDVLWFCLREQMALLILNR